MSLFFNTLNLMLLWIRSDGAEQQTASNGNRISGKVKLTTTNMKVTTEGETGGGGWGWIEEKRKEARLKTAWTIPSPGSRGGRCLRR